MWADSPVHSGQHGERPTSEVTEGPENPRRPGTPWPVSGGPCGREQSPDWHALRLSPHEALFTLLLSPRRPLLIPDSPGKLLLPSMAHAHHHLHQGSPQSSARTHPASSGRLQGCGDPGANPGEPLGTCPSLQPERSSALWGRELSPASGPVRGLFPLPPMLFPQICAWVLFLHFIAPPGYHPPGAAGGLCGSGSTLYPLPLEQGL